MGTLSLKGQVTTAPLVYFDYTALCHRAKYAPVSADPYRLGLATVAPWVAGTAELAGAVPAWQKVSGPMQMGSTQQVLTAQMYPGGQSPTPLGQSLSSAQGVAPSTQAPKPSSVVTQTGSEQEFGALHGRKFPQEAPVHSGLGASGPQGVCSAIGMRRANWLTMQEWHTESIAPEYKKTFAASAAAFT